MLVMNPVRVSQQVLQDCMGGVVAVPMGAYTVMLYRSSRPEVEVDGLYYKMKYVAGDYHLNIGNDILRVRRLLDSGCLQVEVAMPEDTVLYPEEDPYAAAYAACFAEKRPSKLLLL